MGNCCTTDDQYQNSTATNLKSKSAYNISKQETSQFSTEKIEKPRYIPTEAQSASYQSFDSETEKYIPQTTNVMNSSRLAGGRN